MNRSSYPLPRLPHQEHQLTPPTLFILHTEPCPEETHMDMLKNGRKNDLPRRLRTGLCSTREEDCLGSQETDSLLTGGATFCQVIHSLPLSFLICKEGQGPRVSNVSSLLCILGFIV